MTHVEEPGAAGGGRGHRIPVGVGVRRWFLRPPRRHGEIEVDRRVSFLELFYDLVYVVLIGQAAHSLAGDVSWRGGATFVVVFGMIWIAWLNGTLFYELHGREDGRTRSLVFLQMLVLSLMAVYVGHADGDDGRALASLYAVLLLILSWQWYSVYRHDPPEHRRTPRRYLLAMLGGVVVIAASVPLSQDGRLAVWAAYVAAWCAVQFVVVAAWRARPSYDVVTDSMVERFGLFIIIVLGEVVVGVVDGLSEAERNPLVVTTGLISLCIGFGFWWTYADLVARRLPGNARSSLAVWIFAHLPMTMAVAAAGAGMVGLIEHAEDSRTPSGVSWLLSTSVSVILLTIGTVLTTLDEDRPRHPVHFPVRVALAGAAMVSLLLGWARPAPWSLALTLLALFALTWGYAFTRRLRTGLLVNER
ncbi:MULTISPECIES: low temperature requirement protein A [unclassified Streptomyces]|uniref:low temperature requirement protein A n=1 Tax=unclassified Streptomyces TaxID=2593676 RepID=UPI001908D8AA|nr:low temperature requirement protein A [Streptomyces sp. HSG2]